ncbi:hypothetical protein DERP_005291 [Dermatophagoides pteronyssinus]|uniref:Uncharacterized protein n=1 Tax=Dermatophagoides pteronyssinus TaxID=6956 RepID=A0ABQ8JM71_DERPT|nr:hypothetical protein DERP_005291 [Dermatophagoides pteronyssinus]
MFPEEKQQGKNKLSFLEIFCFWEQPYSEPLNSILNIPQNIPLLFKSNLCGIQRKKKKEKSIKNDDDLDSGFWILDVN